jgi:hypothetical protein
MSERMKTREYSLLAPGISNESRFWRTWNKKETDLIELRGESIYAFEFKWGKNKASIPGELFEAYPNAEGKVIHRDNWPEFLLPPR